MAHRSRSRGVWGLITTMTSGLVARMDRAACSIAAVVCAQRAARLRATAGITMGAWHINTAIGIDIVERVYSTKPGCEAECRTV